MSKGGQSADFYVEAANMKEKINTACNKFFNMIKNVLNYWKQPFQLMFKLEEFQI